jgi:hypothetical protein
MPSELKKLLEVKVVFCPQLVSITGTANAALFLSQCLYWSERGKDGWFYKTAGDWEAELGLTRREQETVRKVLVERGFIEEKRGGERGKMHYRVNEEVITAALSVCTKTPNCQPEKEPSDAQISLAENDIVQKRHSTKPPLQNGGNRQTPYIEAKTTTETTSLVRATRLPKDWILPGEWKAWAQEARPDVNPCAEAEKFADYWHSKGGPGATKTDWFATWRNWIRNSKSAPASRGAPLGKPQTLQEAAELISRQMEELGLR